MMFTVKFNNQDEYSLLDFRESCKVLNGNLSNLELSLDVDCQEDLINLAENLNNIQLIEIYKEGSLLISYSYFNKLERLDRVYRGDYNKLVVIMVFKSEL